MNASDAGGAGWATTPNVRHVLVRLAAFMDSHASAAYYFCKTCPGRPFLCAAGCWNKWHGEDEQEKMYCARRDSVDVDAADQDSADEMWHALVAGCDNARLDDVSVLDDYVVPATSPAIRLEKEAQRLRERGVPLRAGYRVDRMQTDSSDESDSDESGDGDAGENQSTSGAAAGDDAPGYDSGGSSGVFVRRCEQAQTTAALCYTPRRT